MPGPNEPRSGPPERSRRRTGAPRSVQEVAPAERLQRTLARAGYGSRRSAEDLIKARRVQVNGAVAELGRRVDPGRDVVTVDGAPIPVHPELRYFAFNKPAGVTSTLRDPHAARSLARYLPPGPRVFPVGRLDRESEGLLLLINDGELGNRLQHPRYGVEKEYLVEAAGSVTRVTLSRLLRGVELDDGPARAVRAERVDRSEGRSALVLVMNEGRKREVRRMLAAVGHPVRRLVRTRMGPVRLEGLPPGSIRPLRAEEIGALYRAAELTRTTVRR